MFECVQINMNSEEPHIQMPGPERDSTLPNRNYASCVSLKEDVMRVVIASDADGMSMKESIKEMLIADGHEVVDYSETPAADFVDSATAVAKDLLEHKDSQGFAFDKYGVGSYMAAVKIKGMVVANISDERSAYMTREHNGSRMVTMGPGVVGTEVAKKIAREFLRAQYAGGRHQIRVDMLNKMA